MKGIAIERNLMFYHLTFLKSAPHLVFGENKVTDIRLHSVFAIKNNKHVKCLIVLCYNALYRVPKKYSPKGVFTKNDVCLAIGVGVIRK